MSGEKQSTEKSMDSGTNADDICVSGTSKEGEDDQDGQQEQNTEDDIQSRYLRLAAEFENYKKRAQKDQEEYTKYANERLLKELLPVLDNLQRALQHARSDNRDGLLQGVELTCKQYLEALSRFGVKPIPSVGLPFDPAVHQAVAMVDAKEGQAPNTIVEEYEKGDYLYDRVLRPAMVTVVASSKNAEPGEPSLES